MLRLLLTASCVDLTHTFKPALVECRPLTDFIVRAPFTSKSGVPNPLPYNTIDSANQRITATMTSNFEFTSEGLLDLGFDPRDPRYPYQMAARSNWSMPLDMSSGTADESRETSPGHGSHQQVPQAGHTNSPTLLTNWPMQQQPQQLPQYIGNNTLMGAQYNAYGGAFQTSPLDYHHLPSTQGTFEAGLQMEAPFNGLAQTAEAQAAMWANWQEIENAMNFAGTNDGLPASLGRQSLGSNSPTGTYLEVLSLPSTGSDNGWATVDHYSNFDSYQRAQSAAIFNPGQTLHLRTHSESSQSDGPAHTMESFGSYEDISNPYSPYSPASDTYIDLSAHRNCYHGETHHHAHENVSPAAAVAPVPIKMSPSSRTTPSSTSSPPARRNSAPRKSPTAKATKPVIRRTSNGKKGDNTEKRVGRRRGPLLPEQRKQASEIRKLRACLRCKFLKKTCDKGEPCAGCQPSHARLWQVPCTRIDIKDIGYFMKDWKADYERHVGRGVSVYNIKGFAQKEELLWITHGYGFAIPIMAREVYVTDESCFNVDWVESEHEEPLEFEGRTERMSAGAEGVSSEALSEYLDKHLDGPFEEFVDEYFEGTPFITEILKTAHRYYLKEKVPVIRKALKLVLAYNLTLHVTMVENRGDEHPMEGMVDDEESKFNGKIIAPVMINFQIKCALADMWRELQKEILEELSSLYSSVYSGDRLKNWPTIFMIASILLAVWEEMQFDCHYRVPDAAAVNKFCNDMETTPVGVIVGLFHAISQKLPAFTEWETRRHGQLLNNNVAVCEAMTEMREHVTKHESYLKTRPDAKFDRTDFDCLSNKFLSKLVIRAN
ncbi:Satratoxin biosynthesis SC3 cluster transcription factor SAT20 [Hyphodiscus hymeniophilus]|uniref:Satratoxin biosynthesis SC3 cluster transcription factor SAT20 n=1 Tax=Hyphodiscus hymeniophilus TaxID=353542 RepID=A0A9P6VIU9_9HELO|nr:Satratoxin biosynthesis SC3 cluster transcription factor SAT20 [Hyphodiscus hymeniophilus]